MNALIIGGGIIGLSIARELRLRGAEDVTVIESGRVGRQASWAAAGMLSPNVERSSNAAFYSLCQRSNRLFPELASRLLEETGVDIELDHRGTILAAINGPDLEHIEQRYNEQKAAGLPVEILDPVKIGALEPKLNEKVLGGLLYPEDGQVENRRMLAALETFARRNGIGLVEESKVDSLSIEKGKVTGCHVGNRSYFADNTIVTTGAWTSLIKIGDADFPIDVKPIRGQMLSFETGERILRHIVCSPRGYVVPRRSGSILVGATVENAGFLKDVTPDGVNSLRSAAVELVPSLTNETVKETWAGLRPFVADGSPVIGKFEEFENLFIATGHYRNGILLAPLTAQLIANMVFEGIVDPEAIMFGPERLNRQITAAP